MNRNAYLHPLVKNFQSHANPGYAERMSVYLRYKFVMPGIPVPLRRQLQKEFFNAYGYPERNEVNVIAENAWQYSEREFQHFAIELLLKYRKNYCDKDIVLIEKFIADKSWWDTVDTLAGWIAGSYFRLFPENIGLYILELKHSKEFFIQKAIGWILREYSKSCSDTVISFVKSHQFAPLSSREALRIVKKKSII